MKVSKLFTLLALAVAITACGGDDEPANNGEVNKPVTPTELTVSYSDLTADYTLKSERSPKRGVSFNFVNQADADLLGPSVSWFYNWGNVPGVTEVADALYNNGVEFFPMAWNGSYNKENIRNYKAAHPACEYILGYNEPNLTDQARMTPSEAAAIWPELKALADELGMKLIAPAMNYGTLAGYSDPIKWLDEFFSVVPISDVHGIAIHCYMGSASALKSYTQRFYKYNLPIWMTEFCAWEPNIGSMAAQMVFMSNALHYLESDPHVERYAWFIPRGSASESQYPYYSLLTKTQPITLTELGELFCGFPVFGATSAFKAGEIIPAERYADCHVSASASESEWVATPLLRPSTDEGGVLEVYNLLTDQWLDYPINLAGSNPSRILIRFAAYIDSQITLTLGSKSYTISLPATGGVDQWKTAQVSCEIPTSATTLRVKVDSGIPSLNWLLIQ